MVHKILIDLFLCQVFEVDEASFFDETFEPAGCVFGNTKSKQKPPDKKSFWPKLEIAEPPDMHRRPGEPVRLSDKNCLSFFSLSL